MTIEVLISCMHQSDTTIATRTGCNTDVVIVNQTDHDGYNEDALHGHRVRMLSSKQRGISRSRNVAMLYAEADICLICDDDEQLVEDYGKIILSAFERHPDADIIAFNYIDKNPRSYRRMIGVEKLVPWSKSFSAVSLAYRRERIIENNVFFDMRIGPGSDILASGEESAWQYLARQKGLKIYQCPDCIATVSQESSGWFKGYTEQYFYDLGANLSYKYGCMKYLFLFYYPYRLRKDNTIPIRQQVTWMLRGIRGFKNGLGYKQYISKYDKQ